MKKFFILMLIVIIAMSFLLSTGCKAGKKTAVTLKLGETHPADYPTTKGDYEFARLVNEATNGRVTIEVYHSKQLGEESSN
jgi:TRAP-type C4-dicarboxylate transport system substrate-binding protein